MVRFRELPVGYYFIDFSNVHKIILGFKQENLPLIYTNIWNNAENGMELIDTRWRTAKAVGVDLELKNSKRKNNIIQA